jgi:hypothetical protein
MQGKRESASLSRSVDVLVAKERAAIAGREPLLPDGMEGDWLAWLLISTVLSRPSLRNASTVVFIPSSISFLRSIHVTSLSGTIDDMASVLRSFRCRMYETAPSRRYTGIFGNQQQACLSQHGLMHYTHPLESKYSVKET